MLNKFLGCYMPENLYDDFLSYLQKYSVGDNFSAMLRVFIAKILELETEGITLANPRKEYEQSYKQKLFQEFGQASEIDEICIRNLNRKEKDKRDREIQCTYCQAAYSNQFKVCQQLKSEFAMTKSQFERK